jgi:hypothetical protein
MTVRKLALGLAANRMAFGVAHLLSPDRAARG